MRLPRDLSGSKLAKTLIKQWGYVEVHQRGSHIVLDTDKPSPQRVVVPNHKTLKIGTFSNFTTRCSVLSASVSSRIRSHESLHQQAFVETLVEWHFKSCR